MTSSLTTNLSELRPSDTDPSWVYDKTFGIVHRKSCRICLNYMVHVNDAQSPLDASIFTTYALATQERDADLQRYFQQGFDAGRQNVAETLDKGDLFEEHDNEIYQYKVQLEGAEREIDRIRHQLIALQGVYDELRLRGPPANHVCLGSRPDSSESALPDALGTGTTALGSTIDGDLYLEQAPADLEDDISSDSEEAFKYVGVTFRSESNEDEGEFHPEAEFVEESTDGLTNNKTLGRLSGNSSSPLIPLPTPQSDNTSSSDSSLAEDLEGSDSEISPSPSPSPSQEDHPSNSLYQLPLQITSIEKIRELMKLAHMAGGEEALAQVRWLVSRAHATPPALRSEPHIVLLTEWRRPSSLNPSGVLTIGVSSFPSQDHVYVDASGVGIGFVFANKWEAWRLRNGWMRGGWKQGKLRDIQWAEAVAVELGLRSMIKAGYTKQEITLCSDNMQVVRAFSQERKVGEPLADEVVDNIGRLCEQLNIHLRVMWVSGLWNPADGPSRLNVGSKKARFPYHAEIPQYLQDVIVPFYQ